MQEAFAKDSDLVQRVSGAYFRMNCPDFDHEILHNLSHTFLGNGEFCWPSQIGSSIKFRMQGWGGRISTPLITLPRLHREIFSSSAW